MDGTPLDVDPLRSVKEPVSRILARPNWARELCIARDESRRRSTDTRRNQTKLTDGKEEKSQSSCKPSNQTRVSNATQFRTPPFPDDARVSSEHRLHPVFALPCRICQSQ